MALQGKDKLVNMETALTTKIQNLNFEVTRLTDEKTQAKKDLDTFKNLNPNADASPELQRKLADYDAKLKDAERKAQDAADLRKVYEDKKKIQRDAAAADASKKKRKKG